ncbi:MAG: hypothetical protein RL546_43, partial [Chloroflexota bacterium]
PLDVLIRGERVSAMVTDVPFVPKRVKRA